MLGPANSKLGTGELEKRFHFSVRLGFGIGLGHDSVRGTYCHRFNLTRWSRVLRDTAASQLNDISRSAGAFARLGSG